MKKNFQVGQKVKVIVNELHGRIGQTGVISKVWNSGEGFYVDFPAFGKFINDTGLLYFPDEVKVVIERKPRKPKTVSTSKPLLQVIVNTKGLARTVRQERNEKGQFVKGARVGLLLNPTHILHLAAAAKDYTVVMVSHNYSYGNQTVLSVNQTSGKGNGVTFVNDGVSGGVHDSIFGGK